MHHVLIMYILVDRRESDEAEDRSQGGGHLSVRPFWLKCSASQIFLRPPALGVRLLAKFVKKVVGISGVLPWTR